MLEAGAEGQEGFGHKDVEGGIPVRGDVVGGEHRTGVQLNCRSTGESKLGWLGENLERRLKCLCIAQRAAGTRRSSELTGAGPGRLWDAGTWRR